MSAWLPSAGGTLLIPSGPTGDHLFVVLSEPAFVDGYGPREQVLLVSFSSIRDGIAHDVACQVANGDHPFIRRPSYAVYRDVRLYPVAELRSRVSEGLFRPYAPVSSMLLNRLRAGLKSSLFTTRAFKSLKLW